jgi:hypothetical protein
MSAMQVSTSSFATAAEESPENSWSNFSKNRSQLGPI